MQHSFVGLRYPLITSGLRRGSTMTIRVPPSKTNCRSCSERSKVLQPPTDLTFAPNSGLFIAGCSIQVTYVGGVNQMPKDPSSRFIRRTFLAGFLILIPLFVTY